MRQGFASPGLSIQNGLRPTLLTNGGSAPVAALANERRQAALERRISPRVDCPSSSLRFSDASVTDYWAVADMHCNAFYPAAGPFWDPFLRLDRVMSLQIGREREDIQQAGRFACLVAFDDGKTLLKGTQRGTLPLGPLVGVFTRLALPPSMRENSGACHKQAGVVGAVVIDTMLDHMPPRRTSVNGGIPRDEPRQGIAYLSNLAVAPEARRCGVGLRLVREAEETAGQWGCRSVALHVDPQNQAALRLYHGAGYRFVAKQPEWQRFLEGRSSPLSLMVRVLPNAAKRREEAQKAAGVSTKFSPIFPSS